MPHLNHPLSFFSLWQLQTDYLPWRPNNFSMITNWATSAKLSILPILQSCTFAAKCLHNYHEPFKWTWNDLLYHIYLSMHLIAWFDTFKFFNQHWSILWQLTTFIVCYNGLDRLYIFDLNGLNKSYEWPYCIKYNQFDHSVTFDLLVCLCLGCSCTNSL